MRYQIQPRKKLKTEDKTCSPSNANMTQGSAANTLVAKSIYIASVVAAYWVVSIALVFLNKYLLSSPDLKFDAPIFVTWFQCFVTVLLCIFLDLLSRAFPKLISFPRFELKLQTARDILPLSLMMVAMVTFNNLCLKYVGVSFYYISRSLATVFNVILSYFILKMVTSKQALVCCAVIIVGYILGIDQEDVSGSLNVMGTVYGVLSSLFVALNAIYTSRSLPAVDNNVWRLTMYNNLNATLLFIPLVLLSGDTQAVLLFEGLGTVKFWFALLVSGIFGFAIGYVTGLQIQATSPLTHSISGTAKSCIQTVIGCICFGEVKTFLWWFSNAVSLFGTMLYTHVKRQEMKKEIKQAAADAAANEPLVIEQAASNQNSSETLTDQSAKV